MDEIYNITVSEKAIQDVAVFDLEDALLAMSEVFDYNYDSLVAAVNVILVDILLKNNFSQELSATATY